MRWRLYYHDPEIGSDAVRLNGQLVGSSFSGESHSRWLEAPVLGVGILGHSDRKLGRRVYGFHEAFGWPSWLPHPFGVFTPLGLLDVLADAGVPTLLSQVDVPMLQSAGVKVGRYAPDQVHLGLWEAAVTDPYLPTKTAWTDDEIWLRDRAAHTAGRMR